MSFEDNRIKIKQILNDKALKYLEEISAEFESQTAKNTRVDTSQTKNAWSHIVDEEKLEATIGNSLENAIWEEMGTGEYALNNDGRKGGWIYKNKKTGKYIRTVGKKPSRAFFKAYVTLKPLALKKAEEIFKM